MNNYTTKEILSAIDSLLDIDKKNIKDKKDKENILILNNEIKSFNKDNKIPKNTEEIIKQAEKFLKR